MIITVIATEPIIFLTNIYHISTLQCLCTNFLHISHPHPHHFIYCTQQLAKQRYNERVLAGTKAFLNLDEKDIEQVKSFIESPDVGGWEDYSAAGYLLSNAFRTNSNKAPDALPSVKAWKAFAKEIELLKRAVSKKDGDKVLSVYGKAEEKLDAYLSEVELPSAMELKQM